MGEIYGYLESDGGKRSTHSSVQSSRPFVPDDSPEDVNGGTRTSTRALLSNPEGIERVSRYNTGDPAEPACHELPSPAARKKLRPEIHFSSLSLPPSPSPFLSSLYNSLSLTPTPTERTDNQSDDDDDDDDEDETTLDAKYVLLLQTMNRLH